MTVKKLVDSGRASLLKYDIRGLTVVADKLKSFGIDIWAPENIGDPIKQGHQAPGWIKDILKEAAAENANWGYCPTEGLLSAREFLASEEKKKGVALKIDDIIFTSGLGHAINTLYQAVSLNGIRTIHPSPTYPAHSSTESFFAGAAPVLYRCDPADNWQPDIIDLEEKIKQHPEIGFILIIAPNNPTGACYSDETLEAMAGLARKYDLGIISDETYFRLLHKGVKQTGMAEILNSGPAFPLIVMKSVSKDIPWPGGRCGWMEFYNSGNDQNFEELKETIKQSLRVQVCSTTMAQEILPKIYGDPRYEAHLKQFVSKLEEQSRYIAGELNSISGIFCAKGQGAFYLSAVFKEGALKPGQTLPIENLKAKEYVKSLTADPAVPLDKRFIFYLMASKGIFLTPLTSFEGPLGFRVTTLKTDMSETKKVYSVIKSALKEYLAS